MTEDLGTKPNGEAYTKSDIAQQDFIDNLIDNLLKEVLTQQCLTYEHDMEVIGEIRDQLLETLEKHYDLQQDTVYP